MRKRVGVVVLGDLGRSPRMLYHTLSLAAEGYQVDLIGYPGSCLPPQVAEHPAICVKNVRPVPAWVDRTPQLVRYLLKAVLQSLFLLASLPLFSSLESLLLQTPPGIPAIPVLAVYSFLKGTRLVIDFHNYSHTILSMSCGARHPLVTLTRTIEQATATTCTAAFCVTSAMKEDLALNWGIEATVLHDRPPAKFRPTSLAEKHELLSRLAAQFPAFGGNPGEEEGGTCLTVRTEKGVEWRQDRPGLVVSSTSWTEDEDFSIFLEALADYDREAGEEDTGRSLQLPPLICVITGKGDLKDYYLGKIAEAGLKRVTVITPWLEAEDYPRMLAAADLGVSLHTSSSGLDLPMKVVDMFGCGLPVAAVDFKCLGELVKDRENGRIFRTSGELAEILYDWFDRFPAEPNPAHAQFRDNLSEFRRLGWDQNWRQNALPVFKQQHATGTALPVVLFFVFLFFAFSAFLPTVQ